MLYLRNFAKPITLDASILFLTCSTLRCDACGDKVSRAKQIVEWMDAVF